MLDLNRVDAGNERGSILLGRRSSKQILPAHRRKHVAQHARHNRRVTKTLFDPRFPESVLCMERRPNLVFRS